MLFFDSFLIKVCEYSQSEINQDHTCKQSCDTKTESSCLSPHGLFIDSQGVHGDQGQAWSRIDDICTEVGAFAWHGVTGNLSDTDDFILEILRLWRELGHIKHGNEAIVGDNEMGIFESSKGPWVQQKICIVLVVVVEETSSLLLLDEEFLVKAVWTAL